jgi:predicted ATPase/DNA-binding winged helix-turn-helix (wHTH) protein
MNAPPIYIFQPFRLLPAQRRLLRADVPVKLGGRAFDLLVALVERRDRVVSKNDLIDICWPRVVVEEGNLQVQVNTLRKLLGHPAIATVPGFGYRFTLPVTEDSVLPNPSVRRPESTIRERPRQGNIPLPLPLLFGRDQELSSLLHLLETNALVTVAGAAGIGKTRLAQAAAGAYTERSEEPVWWVDLASLADSALIPGAVALALGLSLAGGADPATAVQGTLQAAPALLVLDNAEHLLNGVAEFAVRLRSAAPRLHLLVTSQEPLHLEEERVFRPEPLALPDGDDPERIDSSAAVEFFVARVKSADRHFELDSDNRAAVADICRRLDGLPLAIELAAARVPLLGALGLRDKLDQRFRVLTAGRRATLARHQTLRGALDWSYQLLTKDEQAVLRRLGVFVGGFTLEAAQQVADDEHSIDAWDVLEHLGALVDKSLVVAEGDALPRYRLLESTRLFALERLIDSGELNVIRDRHRDHFLQVAEACEKHLPAGDPSLGLHRLDRERDNLLLALAWSPLEEDALLGLRVAAAMQHYWHIRALPSLGADVTRMALARPGAQAPTIVRCRALATAGWLGMWAGQFDEAVPCMEQALNLARSLGDAHTLCFVLAKYAQLRRFRCEEDAALGLASEAIEVGRLLGDSIELADALVVRGRAHLHAGEVDAARQRLGEALAIRRRMAYPTGQIWVQLILAQLAIDEGNPKGAEALLAEALALMANSDLQWLCGIKLARTVANWAAETGQPDEALLLQAACDRLLHQMGMVDNEPKWPERFQRAHKALGDAVADRMRAAGRALDYTSLLQRARRALHHT